MNGSLARRYAKALFELSQEEKSLEKDARELSSLVEILQKRPGSLEALSERNHGLAPRVAAAEGIARRLSLADHVGKFFGLLVKKERVSLLPEIAREYGRLCDQVHGIVRVAVWATEPPAATLLKEIEALLAKKIKKKIVATGRGDPALLGGLLLEVGHTVYDGSIRAELERLREQMLQAPV